MQTYSNAALCTLKIGFYYHNCPDRALAECRQVGALYCNLYCTVILIYDTVNGFLPSRHTWYDSLLCANAAKNPKPTLFWVILSKLTVYSDWNAALKTRENLINKLLIT